MLPNGSPDAREIFRRVGLSDHVFDAVMVTIFGEEKFDQWRCDQCRRHCHEYTISCPLGFLRVLQAIPVHNRRYFPGAGPYNAPGTHYRM